MTNFHCKILQEENKQYRRKKSQAVFKKQWRLVVIHHLSAETLRLVRVLFQSNVSLMNQRWKYERNKTQKEKIYNFFTWSHQHCKVLVPHRSRWNIRQRQPRRWLNHTLKSKAVETHVSLWLSFGWEAGQYFKTFWTFGILLNHPSKTYWGHFAGNV